MPSTVTAPRSPCCCAQQPTLLHEGQGPQQDLLQQPASSQLSQQHHRARAWNHSLPTPRERLPIALYKYADLTRFGNVAQSWPERNHAAPAGTSWQNRSTSGLDLWRAIGPLRAPRPRPAPHFGRACVCKRPSPIAMYWVGETQKRMCAPGGRAVPRTSPRTRRRWELVSLLLSLSLSLL